MRDVYIRENMYEKSFYAAVIMMRFDLTTNSAARNSASRKNGGTVPGGLSGGSLSFIKQIFSF